MNQKIIPPYHAFRIEYPRRTNVLISDIEISLPYAITGEKKQWLQFKAIWDTGATNCVITDRVISALKLKPTGKTDVSTAAGSFERNTYIVDIGLPNKIAFRNVQVTDGNLGNKIDVLVGMDIISSGDFSISNTANNTIFTFCYPSLPIPHNVDLLKITDGINKKEIIRTIKKRKKKDRFKNRFKRRG